MSAMSDYTENKLIDLLFRGRAFSAPTVLAVALFTSPPSDSGGGIEVTGGNYSRGQLNPSDSNWESTQGTTTAVASSGTGGATQNAIAISFPVPSANWGTISHFAIFDALTTGNMLFWGALAANKTVNNGDPAPSIAIGALDVTLA